MIELAAGDLDRIVRFERAVESDDVMGAGSITRVKVAEVRAQILDELPSRGLQSGSAGAEGQLSRIRIRYRKDITSDLLVVHDGRVRQIVGGPSEIGSRAGLEIMVTDYSPQGLSL